MLLAQGLTSETIHNGGRTSNEVLFGGLLHSCFHHRIGQGFFVGPQDVGRAQLFILGVAGNTQGGVARTVSGPCPGVGVVLGQGLGYVLKGGFQLNYRGYSTDNALERFITNALFLGFATCVQGGGQFRGLFGGN